MKVLSKDCTFRTIRNEMVVMLYEKYRCLCGGPLVGLNPKEDWYGRDPNRLPKGLLGFKTWITYSGVQNMYPGWFIYFLGSECKIRDYLHPVGDILFFYAFVTMQSPGKHDNFGNYAEMWWRSTKSV